MIFLTVGTQFPFDRLVKSVDEALGQNGFKEEVLAQIGHTFYQPRNFEAVCSLDRHIFDRYIRQASHIISHAGIGTITMALDNNKPLLVMPRRKCFREHVNDHQVATARKFEQLGHILVAHQENELPTKMGQLRTFMPRKREAQPHAVAERIAQFLHELNVTKE